MRTTLDRKITGRPDLGLPGSAACRLPGSVWRLATSTQVEHRLDVSGLFVFVGIAPNTRFLNGLIKVDAVNGYRISAC